MNNRPLNGELSENTAHPSRKRLVKKTTAAEAILIFLLAAAVAFFTAIIQTCFFFNFRPFGFAPDLCLALTVACGVKFGPKFGGIVGLAAGFFIGAFSAPGFSLAALFYTLVGLAMGIFASPESASRFSNLSLFLMGALGASAITGLYDVISICIIHSSAPVAIYIWRTVFPEMLCTFAFSLAVYLPVSIVSRNLRKRQGLSAKQ